MNAKDRDWEEDASLENGNYTCQCFKCGLLFVGYKRRMECRVCAGPIPGDIYQHEKTGNYYVVVENPTHVKIGDAWHPYIGYQRLSGLSARQRIAPTYHKTRAVFLQGFALVERNGVKP
jgi:hypothetical protein